MQNVKIKMKNDNLKFKILEVIEKIKEKAAFCSFSKIIVPRLIINSELDNQTWRTGSLTFIGIGVDFPNSSPYSLKNPSWFFSSDEQTSIVKLS